MQDLLQDFRIGHEPFAGGDATLEEPLSVDLVRMRCADEVHRYVRVDEGHSASDEV
jgi:hypothetical protein